MLRRAALALFGSAALCLVVAEVGFRLAWHNPYRGENDELVLLRSHHPDKHRVFSRERIDPEAAEIEFRTDARGYVLPSFQHADPQLTVAFLGGSTTECTAVKPALRFPARVSTRFGELGLRVNTLNAARSGNNLQDSLNVYLNHVVFDRPDFVVAMHATNDIGTLRRPGGYRHSAGRPLGLGHGLRWLKQFASDHSSLVGWVRHRLAGVEFRPLGLDRGVIERDRPAEADALPLDEFRRRLRAFAALVRAFDAVPVLMTQPLTLDRNELTPAWADRGAQQRFNDTVRSVARDDGVLLVDLDRHLRRDIARWDEPMRFFYDGMHVTDAGSELYAQRIVEVLQPAARAQVSAAGASRGEPNPPPK